VFAALIDIPANVGYTLVFVLIAIETMGIPVPAETALIGAALLAHRGQMDIATLTLLAATAAILGDNVGFAIGRHFGRRVFVHPGPLLKHRLKVLELGEPFFERHGPKAVFLGRWVAGLRIASAWLAGMNKMPWPTFLFWNALGGITWAASIALSIYFLGDLAEHAIEVVGPISAGIVVAALVAFWIYRRRRKAVEARTTSSGTDGE
jgi:membrane protein DedA with SNARE-associated domain